MAAVTTEDDIEFVPFGETSAIILSPTIVARDLVVKTKKGHTASPSDIRNFIMLCKAQGLNPFVRDAFLVGYDTDDGPVFNLITSHQALLKRAEFSDKFDGIESGVIVFRGDKPEDATDENTVLREGDFVHASEFLLGGWARVWRTDRSRPFSDRIHREVFDNKKSRWGKDPAGMIVKVAEGSALRKAFPSALAGLYCQEEMDAVREGHRAEAGRGLPDLREEQNANRIVIPSERADDRRECVPTSERPTVHEMPKEAEREDVERSEVERFREDPDSEWPKPIANLLGAIKRAKAELSLQSIKQSWLTIKKDYPEAVDVMEAAFERRAAEVAPMGSRPK